ncbi:MAG TPA: acetyl-CoA carboxylase carboxyltransferase subunit alpha [Ktedonobacteraceae bacterium]|nr:acetyl-CoA carboxylase carboxyltransferase subunit alpha [Ktedonobacteraceae bacterium]
MISDLTLLAPWQRVQLARHKERPHTTDYIRLLCEDFFELHGDRRYGDDRAIVAGLASIDGCALMLIGHEKGRDLCEMQERNYGMAHPEGYRKALRLLQQAERLHIPVVTLIDTPGAFPGLEDEQRGIAQAIAENLQVMSHLRMPIVSIIIGEGGSGGALALAVADRVLMMEHAIYTVAAPEAAASILWRDKAHVASAAAAMKITAPELLQLGLIDDIIEEPAGGAHQDQRAAAAAVKKALFTHLAALSQLSLDMLVERRNQRYRAVGAFDEGA